ECGDAVAFAGRALGGALVSQLAPTAAGGIRADAHGHPARGLVRRRLRHPVGGGRDLPDARRWTGIGLALVDGRPGVHRHRAAGPRGAPRARSTQSLRRGRMSSPNIEFSGSIPALYDEFLGPVIFTPYADDLVSRVRGRPRSGRVLETACGTGLVTRRLVVAL